MGVQLTKPAQVCAGPTHLWQVGDQVIQCLVRLRVVSDLLIAVAEVEVSEGVDTGEGLSGAVNADHVVQNQALECRQLPEEAEVPQSLVLTDPAQI